MTALFSLPDLFSRGETLMSAWCGIPEPSVAGVLARQAFDVVTFDMQHGAIDLAEVQAGIPLVAAAGKPAIVRIPVGAFATASKLLDAGAAGIIAPMINTVADARALVAYTKYPPIGERSWGPAAALAVSGLEAGAYFAGANGATKVFAMVETAAALAIVDEILAVEGLDGIFIGPADLSIALSGGAGVEPTAPAVDEALRHARARATAVGKLAAVYAHIPSRAVTFREMGYDLVALASDVGFMRAGAQAMLAAVKG